jgi:uncharacterized membrane protein
MMSQPRGDDLPHAPLPRAPAVEADEILPPESKQEAAGMPRSGTARSDSGTDHEVTRILAHWLDEWLCIPGTQIKIGLDPLLALIPGFGSMVATAAGLIILLESVRHGISLPVLMRMGGNMLINTVLDAIPGIGPVASAFFKSNSRNLRLLHSWQEGQHRQIRRESWQWLILAAALILLILCSMLLLLVSYLWFLSFLWQHLFGWIRW